MKPQLISTPERKGNGAPHARTADFAIAFLLLGGLFLACFLALPLLALCYELGHAWAGSALYVIKQNMTLEEALFFTFLGGFAFTLWGIGQAYKLKGVEYVNGKPATYRDPETGEEMKGYSARNGIIQFINGERV